MDDAQGRDAGADAMEGAEPEGTGAADVTVQALSSVDIAEVRITVSGAGISPPIVQTLSGNAATGWLGTINDIPAGVDREFLAEAFDGSATPVLIYQGVASLVTIVEGPAALVTIFMQQTTAPTPFSNAAPRITGLTVSSYTVVPAGTVSLSVTASDPDLETLTYQWSATSGSFDDATIANPAWTASGTAGVETLTIDVNDPSGATATLDIGITVGSDAGSALVNVDINTSPEVLSLVPDPTQIDVGDTTSLSLTASDPDSDALTFGWTATCNGSFSDTGSEDPTFTLLADFGGADCVLTVDISDGRGGTNSATIAVATGVDPCGGTTCGPGSPG
jgi:hypothetical protein